MFFLLILFLDVWFVRVLFVSCLIGLEFEVPLGPPGAGPPSEVARGPPFSSDSPP